MSIENELKKLTTSDLSYFGGKIHYEEDGTQNYFVFQSINRCFKIISNTKYISLWQSKGPSDETILPPPAYTKYNPLIDYVGDKTRLKFSGSCFKQPKVS